MGSSAHEIGQTMDFKGINHNWKVDVKLNRDVSN